MLPAEERGQSEASWRHKVQHTHAQWMRTAAAAGFSPVAAQCTVLLSAAENQKNLAAQMLQVANKVHLLKFDRLVVAMLPVSCRLSCVIATADMAWLGHGLWVLAVYLCVLVCVCVSWYRKLSLDGANWLGHV